MDTFLYFIGRKDEMIKSSGYRISPTEIEEAAYETGLIGDAVALGCPDAERGQHVVLVVTPSLASGDGPQGLLAALKKVLPGFMLPQRIEIRAEIPRSPNGKFDRARLRLEVSGQAGKPDDYHGDDEA